MTPELLDYQVNGRKASRRGNRELEMAPQGVYPVDGRDRWIAITIPSNEIWDSLKQVMGKPVWADDVTFNTAQGRLEAHDAIDARISEWSRQHDGRALEALLLAGSIPAGLVSRSSDLLADPQYRHLNFYRWHEHGAMGHIPYAGHQYSIEGYEHGPRAPAPLLGEHTFEVLSDLLDLDPDEIAEIAISGALG